MAIPAVFCMNEGSLDKSRDRTYLFLRVHKGLSNRLVCRKYKQGLGEAKNEVAVELENLSCVVEERAK